MTALAGRASDWNVIGWQYLEHRWRHIGKALARAMTGSASGTGYHGVIHVVDGIVSRVGMTSVAVGCGTARQGNVIGRVVSRTLE